MTRFARSVFLLSLIAILSPAAGADQPGDDPALRPQAINLHPGPEYADDARAFQGIPGIERADNGRLWAAWYAGGEGEGGENYVLIATSGDDGETWSGPKLVIDPPGPVRAYDPCLWHDPSGRLWLFWAQSHELWDGRSGVWAITTENSGEETPRWSAPRRLGDGIMMNKPTVTKDGDWLLPAAIWEFASRSDPAHRHDLHEQTGANVLISKDQGGSFAFLGRALGPNRTVDEHSIIEKRDGSLWMLIRAAHGINESFSRDGGRTWDEGRRSSIPHVDSRFFIRRLASGRLLLVTHRPPDGKTRSHLVAQVSDDDGATWRGGLSIDERPGVSYPDGVESPDGLIYLIYDHQRTGSKQILMAVFNEDDVLRGNWDSPSARRRVTVNQATSPRPSK